MSELEIRRLAEHPRHIDGVTTWLVREWPDSRETFAGRRTRLLGPSDGPATLLAVCDGRALGVLAFQRFRRAGDEHLSLFIDALYVDAAARKRGVGTALLEAGVASAAEIERELFVYTASPSWYQSRGWAVREPADDEARSVLSRALPRPK